MREGHWRSYFNTCLFVLCFPCICVQLCISDYDPIQKWRTRGGPERAKRKAAEKKHREWKESKKAKEQAYQEKYGRPMPGPIRLDERKDLSTVALSSPPEISESLILRLPVEVRLLVFEHVLGGNILQIKRSSSGVSGICFREAEIGPSLRNQPYTPLPLFLTCRQFYKEAASVLYKSNFFYVVTFEDLIWLSNTISPQRLRDIKRLKIGIPKPWSLWGQFCRILCKKMELRELKLRFAVPSSALTMRSNWVKPLIQLRGLSKFDMEFVDSATSFVDGPFPKEEAKIFEAQLRAIVCKPD